jgi:threonine aldolase
VRQLTAAADSVSVCLSKGLCAPVGSVVVGSADFIRRARRIRKSLGGGMRQAGVLAAAGLIALRQMSPRLAEDHANARTLAHGLATLPCIEIDLDRVRTNMIFFRLTADAPFTVEAVSQQLREAYGILLRPYNPADREFRIVTHHDLKPAHIPLILDALGAVLRGESAPAALQPSMGD